MFLDDLFFWKEIWSVRCKPTDSMQNISDVLALIIYISSGLYYLLQAKHSYRYNLNSRLYVQQHMCS